MCDGLYSHKQKELNGTIERKEKVGTNTSANKKTNIEQLRLQAYFGNNKQNLHFMVLV